MHISLLFLPQVNVLIFFNTTAQPSSINQGLLPDPKQSHHFNPSLFNLFLRISSKRQKHNVRNRKSTQPSKTAAIKQPFSLTQNFKCENTHHTCLSYSKCAHPLFQIQKDSWRLSGTEQKCLSSKRFQLLILMLALLHNILPHSGTV